jgi:hypothetical protein
MADTFIQVPADGVGKKVRNISSTVNGETVYQQVVFSADGLLTQAMENNTSGQVIYLGEALPGTAKSSSGWRIKKLTYDGFSVVDVQWAGGSSDFDKVWNDRAGYSYS